MGMIVDMVFAVAMVTLTAAAVPEFQIRIGNIRSAAYCTAVGVGILGLCHGGFVGPGAGEGDGFCSIWRFAVFLGQPLGVGSPCNREEIYHIITEEQQIVGDGYQGEQIVGETVDGERQ